MQQSQEDYWNNDTGTFWAEHADQLDSVLQPVNDVILEGLGAAETRCILDVGCGAGALSFAALDRYAPSQIIGVDLSQPLLGVARARAREDARVRFIKDDAQSIALEAAATAIVSRFGIMFFEDPAQGFAGIRKNAAKGARFSAACWQELKLNQWLHLPLEIGKPFLEAPSASPDPYAPGPFALADPARTQALFEKAGWRHVSLKPWMGKLTLPGDTLEAAADFMLHMGPLASRIKEQEVDSQPIKQALIDGLSDHQLNDGRVALEAAIWNLTAKA